MDANGPGSSTRSHALPPILPAGATPVAYPGADRIPEVLHGPDTTLDNLRVLVTGLGVSGYPAAVHLAERGAAVTVIDADAHRDESERERILRVFDVDIRRGPQHVQELSQPYDLVVTSQGWRPDSPVLVQAERSGVPVIGEVELAWRVRGANAAPWLVVTGSNGKTTTTTMLAHMLQAAGLRTRACGNIGQPLLEAVLDPELDVLAIELASFQLHWQFSMCAHSAVVLNLAADHLDWHGGMTAYAAAKAKAYANVSHACVYNEQDPATRALVAEAEVIAGARAIGFTLDIPRPGQCGVVEDVLVDRAFVQERQTAALPLAELSDVAQSANVPGTTPPPHQVANALAAAALARSVGVPAAAVAEGLRAHRSAAHRGEIVAESGGVTWIDNSKATNPHAASAALASHASVVWIAGGLTKGADFAELVSTHDARLRGVVLLGRDRSVLRDALQRYAPTVPIVEVNVQDQAELGDLPTHLRGMEVIAEAVALAATLAEPDDAVVLAPAAASMDQFLNYQTRGELFVEAVHHFASAAQETP